MFNNMNCKIKNKDNQSQKHCKVEFQTRDTNQSACQLVFDIISEDVFTDEEELVKNLLFTIATMNELSGTFIINIAVYDNAGDIIYAERRDNFNI